MLRPATPLSILFFVAFCLLLLSTLSTPIIQSIPLATYRGVRFGVFGYCEGAKCTSPTIGYNTDALFKDIPDNEFSLPSSSRHALSSILIVHPVAAFMTLICFALAAAAHLHSPSHSPRYLLALLIFTFPTLLVSLLAFLVDILLFVPHVNWGGWIALAATIIIVASGIVTCAMRRTLVSRKARKKRIAENDEMNGQAYYANRADNAAVSVEYPKAESPPPFSGNSISGTKGFDNAYFDAQKSPSDDTQPLNQRNPSLRTVSSIGDNRSDTMSPSALSPPGRRQPVDQYGNPIPPLPSDPYMMNNGPPRGPPGVGGRGGSFRGRGGSPPRGGPYGGPYGGPRGRGNGPRGGMRGPPPPGWVGNGRGGRPPQGVPTGRGAPPPGYNTNYYNQGPPPPRETSPYVTRGVSPPAPMPIGQAIEMDNRSGISPKNYGLRESDGDVAGMLALQQGGFPGDVPQRQLGQPLDSSSSFYSAENSNRPQPQPQPQPQQQYIPVRVGWGSQKNPPDQTLTTMNSSNPSRGLSPIQDSPVEAAFNFNTTSAPSNVESTSDYYEDVDPMFAEPARVKPQPFMPASLIPGGQSFANPNLLAAPNSSDPNIPHNSSYDDLPDGSRSPAASEASHFTSVSQRPVNPNWNPELGVAAGQYAAYNGRRPMRQEDRILAANAANPDFAIPGATPGRGRGGRGRGGRGRGGAMGPPPPVTMMGSGPGLGNQSRYPGASAI